MLKQFIPDQYVKSVFEISVEQLKEQGVKGIITDLDNTLVEWDRADATERLIEWFDLLRAQGFQIVIVSNNNEKRVKHFADPHKITFIHSARKPLSKAFKTACKLMNLKREETVVIGDQLLTDILGGNRAGFQTILVVPVAQTDGFLTKFNRRIERRVFHTMKKRGLIEWENSDEKN
ncbi:YqeG family HAD IIIA-type phosphatase [Salipaludibacillus agaradhaerens]|uniref:YqeG family HAD IIIA-type phosphatase n=1 Tax=Salipaludibacillus agaradhaerens TaxID=76935 RepID=A0A9Q4B1Y6_SALAG|nr:YqeG family HAD IIIA-type phosphatase [Salipaludibacillus agaradhaerens]MCR6096819.1 YqeG family HAD IIIA-type phosphatase [Salipaludibacillus agaradhaerens]MCR6106278.1 YqeG family HAD IIIA-type phosphatase [Salipaludibacillus agaradhaerens]MCR6113622.1 YqeG family HAD IIIA-type phosphatase [Salipaludibacillus agaradhaerens]MCR6118311.1 YqeG family HAD IIIA-type phosphatase [Salipaludibacillus agaradhaerens]